MLFPGENVIASQPRSSKVTYAEHIHTLFLNKVKYWYRHAKSVVLLFDDPTAWSSSNDIKSWTWASRYDTDYADIVIDEHSVVPDWSCIFKSIKNKAEFKKVMVEYIEKNANNLLEDGQRLFLNGTKCICFRT